MRGLQLPERKQEDSREKADVAEVVEQAVQPSRAHAQDERQEAGRRLLRRDRQQDRQRQDRADQVLRLAAVQDPGGEQQERVGDQVQQIDEAEQGGGRPKRRAAWAICCSPSLT